MKLSLALVTGLLLPALAYSQQHWSPPPTADTLNAQWAEINRLQSFLAWCEVDANRQEKECDGVNDHIKTKYMEYEAALKLGLEQIEENKKQAAIRAEKAKPVSLGEAARKQLVIAQAAHEQRLKEAEKKDKK